jgi:regulator of sirC expression with transglutaminase-like and TPR domain
LGCHPVAVHIYTQLGCHPVAVHIYTQLGCHPVAVHIYTQALHRTTQITTDNTNNMDV